MDDWGAARRALNTPPLQHSCCPRRSRGLSSKGFNMRKIKVCLGYALVACLVIPALVFAGEPGYQEGVYEGTSSEGQFGKVQVEVIIEGGKITDLQFKGLPDWYPEKVKTGMKEKIIEKQSPRVDAVTGATVSCGMISEAVARALEQAAVPPAEQKTDPAPPRVILETTQGRIELLLYPGKAPRTVENFIGLVEKGYYNGVIFHRVIPGFMIQGGDPTGTGRGGSSLWGKPFPDEVSSGLSFDKPGLLAMANAGPNTNGSQFFITVAPTPWLNGHHTIFGEVVEGYEVVQKMEKVPTGPGNRPTQEQKIIKATVVR